MDHGCRERQHDIVDLVLVVGGQIDRDGLVSEFDDVRPAQAAGAVAVDDAEEVVLDRRDANRPVAPRTRAE